MVLDTRSMSEVSAVIVSWNSAAEIEGCISAALTAGVAEILVVDNGSTDQTREIVRKLPQVKLLHFPENLGFAGGVNRGVEAAQFDSVLILNPDCFVMSGLESMARAAQGGAAGGMLVHPDGKLQAGFAVRSFPTATILALEVLGINRLWPTNPSNQHYRCSSFNPAMAQEVDQPPGAFLMLNRPIFMNLGGMDEAFWPVWFEDVDYCLRLRQAGYKIAYCPEAKATHKGAASIEKILWTFRELAWYASLLRYATKHFGWLSRRLVGLAVAAASVLRAFTGIFFRRQGLKALDVYAGVFRLAWVSLVHDRVEHSRPAGRWEGAKHL